MKKSPAYYHKIVRALEHLHSLYPDFNLGRHLATALDGCDVWSITDKEMLFQLEKYTARMQFDIHPEECSDVDQIIRDGMNLGRLRESLYEQDD